MTISYGLWWLLILLYVFMVEGLYRNFSSLYFKIRANPCYEFIYLYIFRPTRDLSYHYKGYYRLMNKVSKILSEIVANRTQAYIKHYPLYPCNTKIFNKLKSINITNHINDLKTKVTLSSQHIQKKFWQYLTYLHDQSTSACSNKGNILQYLKGCIWATHREHCP